jgi:hypothetical protein
LVIHHSTFTRHSCFGIRHYSSEPTMLLPAIPIFRRRKGRPRPAAPLAPLTWVGASFSPATTILRLSFI